MVVVLQFTGLAVLRRPGKCSHILFKKKPKAMKRTASSNLYFIPYTVVQNLSLLKRNCNIINV